MRLLSLGISTLLLTSLVSCGGDTTKIVTGIDFETRDGEQQEKLLNVDFELDLGENELPFAHYELPNNYGALRLYTNAGMNHAAVDLNLTEILKLPEGNATLPNGQPVPVDTSAGIIEIPVDKINAKVYVAQAQGMTLVGFAMAIEQLDSIGRGIGQTGVFPTFELESVDITAGIFTDEQEGGNGIGVFVNLGRLLDDLVDDLNIKDNNQLAYNRNAFRYEKEYVTLKKQLRLYRAVRRQMLRKDLLVPVLR